MAFSRRVRLRPRLLAASALVAAATVPVVTVPAARAGGAERTAAATTAGGYWMYAADGGILSFGSARFRGAAVSPGNDLIGMAATPSGNGYWMADDDGDVFAAGDATVFGARASRADDVAAFTARPQGDGYWLATRTGGLESFGKAPSFPRVTVKESKRITTVASTASGGGAWMAGLDGGVFTFGDATFFGSMGGVRLNQPVVGMAPTPSGRGYWMVASDGGVFSFGDARFLGSTGAIRLNQPVVGMAPTPSGRGYWMVASDGGVFSFGDARFFGSTGGIRLNQPVRGMVAHLGPPDPTLEGAHVSPPGTPETPGTPNPPAPAGSPAATLVGAGDIAQCSGGVAASKAEATAKVLDGIPRDPSTAVFTAGDNVYEKGSASDYANCYNPTWGRHKDRTRPVPGNHEYGTPDAAGYFDYFGSAAGQIGKGYYSYNLGAWHVVVLNSNCAIIGGCADGSPQMTWLKADLAASGAACTVAMWHHPRFNSGASHGNNVEVQPLWDALYQNGADLILNGHEHVYERFAPQNPQQKADNAFGMRQFTLGTGGAGAYSFKTTLQPNSERRGTPNGVLKLTLRADGYDWNFLPIAGQTFSDTGSGSCHGRP
jgi:calcineurin-like phosphoesterase family protein